MTTLQIRQPQGVPTGGQFAASSHSEPAIELGEDPNPNQFDLSDQSNRDAFAIALDRRVFELTATLQKTYMIGAAQEMKESHPDVHSFSLLAGKHLEVKEAWDRDGNELDQDAVGAASEVFRYRDEGDFSQYLAFDQVVDVDEAAAWRP